MSSLKGRIDIYKWYLFAQSRRFSKNEEVKKAYKDRIIKIRSM